MRALLIGALAFALLPIPASAAAPAPGDDPKFDDGGEGEVVDEEWIVAFEPFADPDEAAALAQFAGGRAAQVYRVALEGFLFEGPEEAARRLARHPRVRRVSANRAVTATADIEPPGVRRIQADAARGAGLTGAGVTVAVLDSGIDLDHPDLAANIDLGLGEDCVNGGDPDDDNGHGSHVAGTVAAVVDGSGVVGVAPEVRLVPVKVLDADAEGSFSDIICGVDHVTSNAGAIDVVNMSLGGASDDDESCTDGSLREAICTSVAAGITYTVSAGNADVDASSRSPASYPEVITVSALDASNDGFASFSNAGSVVDVIAPGVAVLSTYRRGRYKTLSGTSMSAPHVAGVAALALAADPTLSPEEVRARLRSTGECPDGSEAGGDGSCGGQGMWNGDGDGAAEPLVNALRAGVAEPDPPVGSDPSVTLKRPGPGAPVAGDVVVKAVASDGEDPAADLVVEYRIDDGAWVAMAYRGDKDHFKAVWDSRSESDGEHTLAVRATDSAGAAATETATVTVDNTP